MNETKYAKDLTAGEWIVVADEAVEVAGVFDYANGWMVIHLADGNVVDCLAYSRHTLD